MKATSFLLFIGLLFLFSPVEAAEKFIWPAGKHGALSLTFDDARESQLDVGIPLLNRYGVKGTFYVLPQNVKKRLAGWQEAVSAGHEIGNHTIRHSCSGNHAWSQENALEERTIDELTSEIDLASESLETMLDVVPVSFAYPCGQIFVGRGRDIKTYVPDIAERFLTGRTYGDDVANDPVFCDLAKLTGLNSDDLDWEEVKALIDVSARKGSWLILVGHEVGIKDGQTTSAEVLKKLLEYVQDSQKELWVAPVNEIASYLATVREDATQIPPGIAERAFDIPKRYAGPMMVLGSVLIGFAGGLILFRWGADAFVSYLSIGGVLFVIVITLWSLRDGLIGVKGLLPVFAALGYCLGGLGTAMFKKHV